MNSELRPGKRFPDPCFEHRMNLAPGGGIFASESVPCGEAKILQSLGRSGLNSPH